LFRVGATGAKVKPDSSTRIIRIEPSRPSQPMRGSA
jgi:hypothetical protein